MFLGQFLPYPTFQLSQPLWLPVQLLLSLFLPRWFQVLALHKNSSEGQRILIYHGAAPVAVVVGLLTGESRSVSPRHSASNHFRLTEIHSFGAVSFHQGIGLSQLAYNCCSNLPLYPEYLLHHATSPSVQTRGQQLGSPVKARTQYSSTLI